MVILKNLNECKKLTDFKKPTHPKKLKISLKIFSPERKPLKHRA